VRVAVFFHLGGDIDILAPVVAASDRAGVGIHILAAEKLHKANARLGLMLGALGRKVDALAPADATNLQLCDLVAGCDALLTASETTLRPHALAHRLTIAANEIGIATYTMQHGVENVGLTYFDDRQGPDVLFASGTVFTWAAPELLPGAVDPSTRAKAVGVGYSPPPTDAFLQQMDALGLEREGDDLVGVFENLHWTRYSDAYRERFLADLEATCRQFPKLTFVFKPHPEGRWLTKRFLGPSPAEPNLVVADPDDERWSLMTAPTIVRRLAAVVTTPSKTALDAAVEGVPVAIASYDGRYDMYDELPALASAEDWRAFIAGATRSRLSARPALDRFRQKVSGAGDGARSILKVMLDRRLIAGSKKR